MMMPNFFSESSRPGGTVSANPVCPLFGLCGGCQYQDLNYQEECRRKSDALEELLKNALELERLPLSPLVPSPREYDYRCRLDMKLLKTRAGDIFMGFSPAGKNRVVEAVACPIALTAISDFLPELKKQAVSRLPARYRNANLVVKSGDDGRVFWGGIGRRSLKMNEADYLWTQVRGRKIYFSLDTFFQANLSILPAMMARIIDLGILGPDVIFFDLYGGVGLFGVALHDLVKEVVLVEENVYATQCAAYNAAVSRCGCFRIITERVENVVLSQAAGADARRQVAIVDPPRQGLNYHVAAALAREKAFRHLMYLSCHMDSLARDLKIFLSHQWIINTIIPFDFFPKTRHLETLVLLSSC